MERLAASNLTDEQVLKEFVKRFRCEGAVLIYLDETTEYGFGRWRSSIGKKWVSTIFRTIKEDKTIIKSIMSANKGISIPLNV
jgi:hypothetical protein